jgi:hypothetical protein
VETAPVETAAVETAAVETATAVETAATGKSGRRKSHEGHPEHNSDDASHIQCLLLLDDDFANRLP